MPANKQVEVLGLTNVQMQHIERLFNCANPMQLNFLNKQLIGQINKGAF